MFSVVHVFQDPATADSPRPIRHGLKPEATQVLPLAGLPCIFLEPSSPRDKEPVTSEFLSRLLRAVTILFLLTV